MNFYRSAMLFVLAIPFVINAQCDQNQVLIDCYHSLGGTVTVRNGSGFIIYQNIINSYTGTDVYSFELSLADGCYTIQQTNDNYFITNIYGVDSNGSTQYYHNSSGPSAQFGFSVGGTGGCGDPAAVNYIPNACDIWSTNYCEYSPQSSFVTVELCETFNGYFGEISFSIYRTCNYNQEGYGGNPVDGGHTIHQFVLSPGEYTMYFYDPGVPYSFEYTVRIDGVQVAFGSDITDEVNFTVGGGDPPPGCTDSYACNYSPYAICDDGSCQYGTDCCIGSESLFHVDFLDEENFDEYACFDFYDNNGTWITGGCVYEYDGYNDYYFCIPAVCYGTLEVYGYGSYQWQLYDGTGALATDSNSGDYQNDVCMNGSGGGGGSCNDPSACNFSPGSSTNAGCGYDPLVLSAPDDGDGTQESATYTIVDNVAGGYPTIFSGTLNEGDVIPLCHYDGYFTISFFDPEGGMNWQIEEVTIGTLTGTTDPGFTYSFYTTNGGLIYGCTDPAAINYENWASIDAGTCLYDTPGCTDAAACNYNPDATEDNGTCFYNGTNTFHLSLADAGNNGWQGTRYQITDINGTLLIDGTLLNGGTEPVERYFCLPDGCYTLNITSGANDSEVSWTIWDINNQPGSGVGSGAPFYGFQFFFGTNPPAQSFTIEMWENGPASFQDAGWTMEYNGNFLAGTGFSGNDYAIWPFCNPEDGCYFVDFNGGTTEGDVTWRISGAAQGSIDGAASNDAYFTIGSGDVGCTDSQASNYNPAATCDNNTCSYSLPGDYTDDGAVNTGDLLILLSQMGCTTNCTTDLTGDGIINISDIIVFLSFFGTDN